ncbi:rhomboid family intramembrane serine protease [Virgibacillus byunsanensis]|uniref:Rhomboid family intramembrane serine protease n=1 Tax=Virgibacillus byunsanensis TaxID=570945 RepID=A0ABW3LKC7_9BACI
MYLDEQYTMYKLAYSLVKYDEYEVLHINENDNEIWLEKYNQKTSYVIRLCHGGFDWKNHLKKDIAQVFQKTKAMKRLLIGKQVEIYNMYISSHEPVDDWDILKKPMQLNEKNPLKMKVYYITEETKHKELDRIQEETETSKVRIDGTLVESEKENDLQNFKTHVTNALYGKRKEIENIFSYGKPRFTYMLLMINLIVFFMLESSGGSTDIENLINFGAKYNPAIIDNNEWWRIITSMFLHIGLLHLFMNMLAVYYLGITVERIYGSIRFLVIYFLAGIGGGLASFAFTVNVSAGASGALFGLFGALLFFGLIHKKIFFQTMGKGLLILIGINIIFGFAVPQVDNGAHLGGLFAGFLASAILHLPKKKNLSIQLAAVILYIVIITGLVVFGTQNNLNSASYQLIKIEELVKVNNYEEIVQRATIGLEDPKDVKPHLLFQRSYANIHLNNPELAIKDLEETIQLTDEIPEAYYNLASLYHSRGEMNKAKESIEKAYELNSKKEEFSSLYEKIIGEKPK